MIDIMDQVKAEEIQHIEGMIGFSLMAGGSRWAGGGRGRGGSRWNHADQFKPIFFTLEGTLWDVPKVAWCP